MPQDAAAAHALKIETAPAHRDLENFLTPRITHLKSNAGFAEILSAFHCFLKPLEPKINEIITPSLLPDVAERKKILLLEKGLESLEAGKNKSCEAKTPVANSLVDALGIMYVLEGSTLGGKSIVRMLRSNPHLDLSPEHYQYFDPYGEATGQKWKSFQAVLDRTIREEKDLENIIHAANHTFRCFEQTLKNYFI